MGLIHEPNDITAKCTIFDLSCIQENEILLQHHILSLTRWRPVETNEPDSISFPRLNLDMEYLDLDQLIGVYTVQRMIVDHAIRIGETRRLRARTNAEYEDPGLADFEAAYDNTISLAQTRKSTAEIIELIDHIKKEAKPGDIIDICDYRGTGYYLVTSQSVPGTSMVARKTLGRYGCHLPVEAWPFLLRYGVDYYEKCDVWACQIPDGTLVFQCKQDQSRITRNTFLSWLHADDRLIIEGSVFLGDLLISS